MRLDFHDILRNLWSLSHGTREQRPTLPFVDLPSRLWEDFLPFVMLLLGHPPEPVQHNVQLTCGRINGNISYVQNVRQELALTAQNTLRQPSCAFIFHISGCQYVGGSLCKTALYLM